jgi:NADPH:quinone reductase-like Zn-dependent oxidoreductase
MVATGEIAQPGFGQEAAGIVRAIGSPVSGFLPGNQVICLGDSSPGRMGIHSDLVIKIPESLSFQIAAGLPVTLRNSDLFLVSYCSDPRW